LFINGLFSAADGTEDEQLVHVDPDPLVVLGDNRAGKTEEQTGNKLQALLYHGMAKPIIRVRYIILGKVL
jgi:hypothetical protein